MSNDEDFEALLEDVGRYKKRLDASKYLEFKKEASENLIPLLERMVEAIDQRCARTEEMVAEIIEETESVVHAELAEQIYATVELGQSLCDAVDQAALDDVTKKRLAEITQAFRIAANLTLEAVAEVALEPDDDSDLIDEDPDDDDDDEAAVTAEDTPDEEKP